MFIGAMSVEPAYLFFDFNAQVNRTVEIQVRLVK